jgi:hypothetical protein
MRVRDLLWIGCLCVVLAACAPKQLILLDVWPQPATLYVDGKALETIPSELELRSDRAHVLYFKSEGYRPARVVLESREVQGEALLAPAEVKVRLLPAGRVGRSLVIEPDRE